MLRQEKSDLERYRDERALHAFQAFLQDIAVQQKEKQKAYSVNETYSQVFLSYAWEPETHPPFIQLQAFLNALRQDFEQAGVRVWLDLSRLVGHIENNMREGIQESDVVLLMGTTMYATKTAAGSLSNVRKELDFSLDKASTSASHFSLIPLLLEGTAQTIFPSLGQTYLRQDNIANWLDLKAPVKIDTRNYIRDMPAYIRFLTQWQPVGLLPAILGLHKQDSDYKKALRQTYERSQKLLMTEIEKIYALSARETFTFPIRKIDLKDIQLNRDKDRLGEGSFGTVYKAQWNQMPVAVKEIRGTLSADTRKHFHTEAEVMVRANSSWVVRLYGIILEPQRAALVMEYMPNGSLHQFLHSGEPIDWKIRYQISQDVAHGLMLLHADNILHRDLKSDNVLLDNHLRAKLSDFGLSKIKSASRSSTRRIEAVGTEGWMAPELLSDLDNDDEEIPAIPYSAQSDIYAYGMVLWEIASRKIPYEGQRPSQIEKLVTKKKREKIPEDCPPSFSILIQGAWKQEPAERLKLPLLVERLKALENEMGFYTSAANHTVNPLPVVSTIQSNVITTNQNAMTSSSSNASTSSMAASQNTTVVPMGQSLPNTSSSSGASTSLIAFSTPGKAAAAVSNVSVVPELVKQFLKHVVEGEQDKAEAMLKQNKALALVANDVTDLSGRTFQGITGFQYAVWALDWHMWTMLRQYLPQDVLKEQLQGLKTGSWVRQYGESVSWQALIDAQRKTYSLSCQEGKTTKRDQAWIKEVGGAQRHLPMHVINEYCHPTRSFHPCPDFTGNEVLPRNRQAEVYQNGEWVDMEWNSPTCHQGKLGESFAFIRGDTNKSSGCGQVVVSKGWMYTEYDTMAWGNMWCGGDKSPLYDRFACHDLLLNRGKQRDLLLKEVLKDQVVIKVDWDALLRDLYAEMRTECPKEYDKPPMI